MKFNTRTITLTTDAFRGKRSTEVRAKALAILLGEYNMYGRSIPLEDYEDLQKQFYRVVMDMEYLVNKYNEI